MATRTPKIPARSTLLNSSLDGMDDLFDFKTKEDLSQPEQENGGTGITEMDFAVMEPLPNHKFKLYTGQRLWDMVDSIREFGILEPLIVWVHDGKNTILSGHNRQNAGSIAGLTKGPVIIRENLTYEDAILIENDNGEYWVSLNVENKDSMTSFNIGDEIVVYYDGNIAESYPMQINTVYAITLKTPADRAENDKS